jgi:hypothetical protein
MAAEPVDTHDPAGMARWLRERRDAALEFYKLDGEAQQRQFLQRWQQHVLPHLAFRFGQAATMIEQLAKAVLDAQAECARLRATLEAIASFPVGEFRPLADEIAIHKQAADALKGADDVPCNETESHT